MMNSKLWGIVLAVTFTPCITVGAEPSIVENVIVYKAQDRFAGWPANNGIWNWGDEIVVGFTLGYHDDNKQGGHPIDRARGEVPHQARSLDGGRTWTIEVPNYLTKDLKEPEPQKLLAAIDFTSPDFAMNYRMEHSNSGYSHFYYSYNRCKTWVGPFKLPTFGRSGIFARTDYLINGKHDMQIFLTAAKNGGGEGWPFCARTTDGGQTWKFVGWIGPQPGEGGYAIMPSTVRLKSGGLLTMIRRRGRFPEGKRWWLEPFLSPDDGQTWYLLDEPTIDNRGNPAAMIRLKDGRICLTWGSRSMPYGARAMLSEDEGQSWSDEIILRDNGKVWDLGYPRTVQRADGNIFTAYYFNDDQGKERYIAGTIWNPGTPSANFSQTEKNNVK